MDTAVDDIGNGIDPEAEVRKLQDLVKKLERQNQILRSKQNREPPVIHKPGTEESKQNRTCTNDTDNIKDGFKKLTLEEVDLVDVDKVTAEEDEETWLFQSPKQQSPEQTTVSPYKWLRHEFENPSPEVDTARRSLLFKLDEVARGKSMSQSSSSGTLGSLSSPTSAPSPYQADHQHQHGTSVGPPATRSPPTSVCVPGLGSRVNTGTFTRPKKQQNEKRDPELIDDCNTSYINSGTFTRPKKLSSRHHQPDLLDDLECVPLPVNTGTFTRPRKNKPRQTHSADELEADDEMENDVAGYDVRTEPNDEDPIRGHEHKFSDVTSLQVVARMQEESLRQSFTSPLMSPRRSEEYKSKCLSKDSLASTASSHSNSNTSSPPNSPYGSQYLDQKPQVSDTHRRSLPNLVRSLNQGGLQAYQSDSRLQPRESPPRSLQKPGSMSQRARNPGSGARQASPGRTLSPGSPGRTLSPGRSGIPSPRSSGIPRPGSSSKLPQPRNRSGIPSPRRSSNTSRGLDDSWKEGCY